jgi:hypothetical protein
VIDAEKELDKARITLERLDKSKSDFIAVAAQIKDAINAHRRLYGHARRYPVW